jgi:hypothetical protein
VNAAEELLNTFLAGGEEQIILACQAREFEDPFLEFKSTSSTADRG